MLFSSVWHVNERLAASWENGSIFFTIGTGPVLRQIAEAGEDGIIYAGLIELEHPHKVIPVFAASLSLYDYKLLHGNRTLWSK